MREIKKQKFSIEIDTSDLIANLAINSLSLVSAISTGDKSTIVNALIPFINIFSCIDIKNSKEKDIYEYVTHSLSNATLEVLSILDKEKLSKPQKRTLSKEISQKEKRILVDEYIFEKPSLSEISSIYIELLCSALETISPINDSDIRKIRFSWDKIFSLCAKKEWENNIKKYSGITSSDYLLPMQKYVDAIEQREKYEIELKKLMSSKVFDEDCKLKDIFIDLNCVIDPLDTVTREEQIQSSIETLQEWASRSTNGMLLIEGDPGSGKSTLLKELTRNLINQNIHVIHFNLFKLPFSSKKSCIDVFIEELRKLNWYNVLEVYNDSNLVFILDGLDEIQCDVWNNSIELVRQLRSSDYYKHQKIILSGRKRIIEYCHEKIGNIKTLTILPLNYKNDNFSTDLLDLRSCLWEKLKSVFNLHVQFKEISNKENLNEISENPLLLFLLAWTFKNEPASIDKVDNSVQLYRQILNCIYNRKYSRSKADYLENKIEFNSYLRILNAIGTSAWRKNKREIPVTEIEKYCKKMDLSNEFNKWFNDKECVGSSKLFLMFFAHEKHDLNDSSFEFLHKSFYEYLSIEEIMLQIKKCRAQPEKVTILRFFYLLSNNYIDTDFIYYFIEELYNNNIKDFLRLKDDLFYIHSLLENARVDYYIFKDNSKCALFDYISLGSFFEGYEYVHNNIWRLIEYIFIIYSNNPILDIQNEFCIVDIYFSNLKLKISNLKYLIFNDCRLSELIITHVKFTNGKWINCVVNDCIFCQGNFNYVEITNSKFYSTHLESTSFDHAKIINGYFDNSLLNASFFNVARINDTVFEDCIFDFANFDDAEFSDTRFSNCSFENADFNGAIFNNCKFINCSFINTKLANIKMSNFNLDDNQLIEDLREADCSMADFSDLPNEIIEKFKT